MCGSGNTGTVVAVAVVVSGLDGLDGLDGLGEPSGVASQIHVPMAPRAAWSAKTPYPWVRDGSTTAPCVRPKHVLHVGRRSGPNMKVCVRHIAHARERMIPPKKNALSSLLSSPRSDLVSRTYAE
jgi:hypothetical protein